MEVLSGLAFLVSSGMIDRLELIISYIPICIGESDVLESQPGSRYGDVDVR